jgi:hypothetical protein
MTSMTCNAHVMVLRHDVSAKVAVCWDVDLTPENKEPFLLRSFCALHHTSCPIHAKLTRGLCDWLLEVAQAESDVFCNGLLFTLDGQARKHVDPEQFWAQKGQIAVVV